MKIKTQDMTDAALDWAVSQIEKIGELHGVSDTNGSVFYIRYDLQYLDGYESWSRYSPSTDPAQAYPIIFREGISLIRQTATRWVSEYSNGCGRTDHARSWGITPLIAAMRCYVASELGDEVDVPEVLCQSLAPLFHARLAGSASVSEEQP